MNMLLTFMADSIGIEIDELQRLLEMAPHAVLDDPSYQGLLQSLDLALLRKTLPLVRAALARGIPTFNERYQAMYSATESPMSEETLSNWLVVFIQYPNTLRSLVANHQRVPVEFIRLGLPDFLSIVDGMPRGCAEWQRAMAVLAVPLLVR